jgi:hypothetical protein
MLKRTNVISTLTTVISTRTRVISTRRVWCWYVWLWLWHSWKWLWHSYVLKPHSACRNHSCVWFSHAYCDDDTHECNFWTKSVNSTRTSVIYISIVRFPHAECNFPTQSMICTQFYTFNLFLWKKHTLWLFTVLCKKKIFFYPPNFWSRSAPAITIKNNRKM